MQQNTRGSRKNAPGQIFNGMHTKTVCAAESGGNDEKLCCKGTTGVVEIEEGAVSGFHISFDSDCSAGDVCTLGDITSFRICTIREVAHACVLIVSSLYLLWCGEYSCGLPCCAETLVGDCAGGGEGAPGSDFRESLDC